MFDRDPIIVFIKVVYGIDGDDIQEGEKIQGFFVTSLVKKFTITAILILLLISCCLVFLYRFSNTQDQNNAIINMAGKQSALCHAITESAYMHFSNLNQAGNNTNLNRLTESLEEFRQAHRVMDRTKGELNMGSLSTITILKKEKEALVLYKGFTSSIDEYIETNNKDILSLTSIYKVAFLESMDELVSLYVKEAGASYHMLQYAIITSFGIIILLIVIVTRMHIKDLVNTQKELEQSVKKANAASRAKSAFLATMSHEIRTPLNAVTGMSTLLHETPLTPQQQELVSFIRGGSDSLLSIINNVLDYSKIEADGIQTENEVFSLDSCFIRPLKLISEQASKKGLSLAYSIPPDIPSSWKGDSFRIKQVITNLVGNAVKFTHKGSIVIQVEADKKKGGVWTVRFIVKDTGIGMTEEERSKLFKVFSQASSSVQKNYGGTGLGLVISKKLARILGGDLTCRSVKHSGTEFILAIPLTPEKGSKTFHETFIPEALKGKSILFIDSEPLNRTLMKNMLNVWGLEITTVPNLSQAQRLITAHYDLVIMEYIQEDESDSLSFIESLAGSPIMVALSDLKGYSSTSLPEIFLDHLLKPLDPSVIKHKLIQLLLPNDQVMAEITNKIASENQPLNLNILVADDNKMNRLLLAKILRKLSLTADYVENGKEAFEKASQKAYDVILMDMEMPVLDGVSATKAIRGLGGRITQPQIIALTANAFPEQKKRCFDAGMNDFLTKPLEIQKLKSILYNISIS